ncbi:Fc receptor-like protein [Sarotherodon galilaeus]
MEEDLEYFLRSREVPHEDIMHMQQDKVDKAVLSVMTVGQMAQYISTYGDRVAVQSFCQQTKYSTDKETLLQNLRDKIEAWKVRSCNITIPQSKTKGVLCGSSGVFHKQAEKTCRKIEIGWLHLSSNEYRQVRTRNGGGTRHATVEKTTTVAKILEMGKVLFFPDGNSPKGRVEDFVIDVCDFKRNPIPLDDTVGKLYEQTKLKLVRFYICTKDETPSTVQSSSEEDFSVSIIEEDSLVTLI